MTSRRSFLKLVFIGTIILASTNGLVRAADEPVTIFAAASLKDALDEINAAWAKGGRQHAKISLAGSSALAKQIEQGAPADIFISADRDWMDYLAERTLIKANSRVDLLGNTLVLIAPKDSTLTAELKPGLALAEMLGDGRLAVANTDSVPAGKYGKQALQSLQLWDGVKDKLAQAENVRAALQLVSRGEAPLGIVYATDARADPKVKVLATFPERTHTPIVYPAAVIATSKIPDAENFLDFLKTSTARSIFSKHGFSVYTASG